MSRKFGPQTVRVDIVQNDGQWITTGSKPAGINSSADTLDTLLTRLEALVPDFLETTEPITVVVVISRHLNAAKRGGEADH